MSHSLQKTVMLAVPPQVLGMCSPAGCSPVTVATVLLAKLGGQPGHLMLDVDMRLHPSSASIELFENAEIWRDAKGNVLVTKPRPTTQVDRKGWEIGPDATKLGALSEVDYLIAVCLKVNFKPHLVLGSTEDRLALVAQLYDSLNIGQ